jgi:hypothetical protein
MEGIHEIQESIEVSVCPSGKRQGQCKRPMHINTLNQQAYEHKNISLKTSEIK